MALAFVKIAGRSLRKEVNSRDLMARLAAVLRIVALAMAALLIIAKCVLPLLALAARLKIHSAAAAILSTQPVLFLILNSTIVAILAPSGLFRLEEPPHLAPASPSEPPLTPAAPLEPPPPVASESPSEAAPPAPPPSPPATVEETGNLPVSEEHIPDVPKLKVKKAKRSSSTSSRVLKRNQIQSQSRTQSIQSSVHQVQSHDGSIVVSGAAIDESNRENIPPLWGSNNVAAAAADSATNSLKDEDFKRFIDSFIARARHQMMFQEQMEIAAERSASMR